MHPQPNRIEDGRKRVVIEAVTPQIECGRFPIKRVLGDSVTVEADAFADGHDVIVCRLLYRAASASNWERAAMSALGNDRWRGEFRVRQLGSYRYCVSAWVDPFLSWRRDLGKRRQADQDLAPAFAAGIELVERARRFADPQDALALDHWLGRLARASSSDEAFGVYQQPALAELTGHWVDPQLVSTYAHELEVSVERERARFSAWYEMFPRSAGTGDAHGTFQDCVARLPYVAEMGFDVLYLPPIHPIGDSKRKGKNNTTAATAEDVGSPWAVGSRAGGHKAIHPALGTLADFRVLVGRAKQLGIEIALDMAFQCSPDHPYVRQHPQWFRKRRDGSIQHAENPPKKYEDIYPFDFESDDWQALWEELKSVFLFWREEGVRAFRVDNPHTKAFAFWRWVIGEVKRQYPDVIFLSEAFTRPKVMHRLTKLGFTQSYTYFAWRNTKWELEHYFDELAHGAGREYFWPNVWPNTPDILNEYLQFGGRPAFIVRLALAATLSASYGIYGPAFELAEREAIEPGSEEYLHSEKYEIRRWDRTRADSLKYLVATVNTIRRDNPALHRDGSLRFHAVDNDQIVAYSKHTEDYSNAVLVLVNLDPYHTQSGWLELPLEALDIAGDQPYQMHDLLAGARYIWHGPRNFVQLDPHICPAHIFRLRRRVRSERDFDYYM